jgi:hypothetical protein
MPGSYNPYIPTTDAALDTWATNFDAVITANPTDYGLVAGQATAFHTLRLAFTTALATSSNPATRTSVTVAAKDAAKADMVVSARSLAMVALAYPLVTPSDLLAAGLIVKNTVPTPIPAPTTVPLLDFLSSIGQAVTIGYADETSPSAKYKPFGVIGLQVFTQVGGTAPVGVETMQLKATVGRWPIRLQFAGGDVGENVYVMARWVTRKGLTGPSSALLTAVVQA